MIKLVKMYILNKKANTSTNSLPYMVIIVSYHSYLIWSKSFLIIHHKVVSIIN